jgi:Fic family protein
MSFNPNFTITNRMTQAITRIERARGFLEAAQLSADWVREVGEQALILEAHHTTHIEGTRLTLDQAERLWKGEAVPEADPDDARELLNYRTAFEFVSECLDSGDPITEGMIREIHRKLVEGVRGGSAAPGGIPAYPELRGQFRHRPGHLHSAHGGGGANDDFGAGQVAER